MAKTTRVPTQQPIVDDHGHLTSYGIKNWPVVIVSTTVAALPSASGVGGGFRTFVTDSNATTTAGIGAVVAGGGSNGVPVYSDGTNWRIG
jgi:hypothetical protein